MRLVARWGGAVVVSAAGFVLAWWVCQELIRLDEGISLGIAGVVLAVLLAVAAWWASRSADSGKSGGGRRRLGQKARAGRHVNMAGRDQTISDETPDDEELPQLSGVMGPVSRALYVLRHRGNRIFDWDDEFWQDDGFLGRAAGGAIKTGLLMFNVPAQMVQGKEERVEVGIARSADLRKELLSGLRYHEEPEFEEISTSVYMEVRLEGPTFQITSRSPAEQLIIPEPGRWEFDILPRRAGNRKITLFITMRIEAQGIRGGRRAVPSLEKQINVQVNVGYATRRFVMNNWQWLIPTVLTLAGTIAAWLVVPF